MARRRNKSPVRKRRRSRSFSSDSRSYSRSRSPSDSTPSRGGLRQPPQLRGQPATADGKEGGPTPLAQKSASAQIAQKNARITALESELVNSKKNFEEVQKQLAETTRKLKRAEAAQDTYEKWLEALSGVANRVVSDQQKIVESREALRKLEAETDEAQEDLALYVKETNSFIAEQAEAAKQEKSKSKKVQTPVETAAKEDETQAKAQIPASASNEAGESQSIFRPGIKFKLNP